MFVSAIFLLFVQIRTVRLSFAYRVLMYLHVTVMSQITPYGVGNMFNWISVHQSNQSINTNTNNKPLRRSISFEIGWHRKIDQDTMNIETSNNHSEKWLLNWNMYESTQIMLNGFVTKTFFFSLLLQTFNSHLLYGVSFRSKRSHSNFW